LLIGSTSTVHGGAGGSPPAKRPCSRIGGAAEALAGANSAPARSARTTGLRMGRRYRADRGKSIPTCISADAVDKDAVEVVREGVRVGVRSEPGVGPVRRREHEERGGRVVQVAPQLPELAALAKERPKALLVAPALGHDLAAPLALEVAPLPGEDGRHV